jgi:paraquat-inducible protein A
MTKTHPCAICNAPVEVTEGEVSTCGTCGHRDHRHTHRSEKLSLAFSLTALIFYIPANFLPFMTIELYGDRNSSTILGGVITLMDQQSYLVALVVFLASILIPVMKLLILFYLSVTGRNGSRPRFKMRLYQFVEAIGRWSMLDIFLLAILVAIVKLGHWTSVQPELGSVLFMFVVIFTMMASAYFDPRILWEKQNENANS